MITLHFQKWQGAGNDFVIADNRNGTFPLPDAALIRKLCNRHFGIGSDGFMLIEWSDQAGFGMKYWNSDGLPAEMCGNGGRCIAAMAHELGIVGRRALFSADDGLHEAEILQPDRVRLKMADVLKVEPISDLPGEGSALFLNTGVPHLVVFREQIDTIDVDSLGQEYRNHPRFAPAGTNVNFVRGANDSLAVRTFERGVEAETLACGTGNVAAAIAAEWHFRNGFSVYTTHALGGTLKVSFRKTAEGGFTDVHLEGPAVKVFEGVILI